MAMPQAANHPRSLQRTFVRVLLFVIASAVFVVIVAVRQGPPSGGDTVPLVSVTTELSNGDLGAAASDSSLPNPPGYALLVSPIVVMLRGLVGSPDWCTPSARADALRRDAPYDISLGIDIRECGSRHRGPLGPPLPPWYRSQGVIGLLGWLILALGCLSLLGVCGAATIPREAALLAFLACLPAASSAIVQLYHPQDMVSLGLSAAALAFSLQRRWLIAGALFGLAFLNKQFAILVFVPVIVGIPTTARERLRLGLAAVGVALAGVLPFLVAAPRATLGNLSGFSAGGAYAGSTVVSLLGASGHLASAIARDAPVAVTIVVCLLAARQMRENVQLPRYFLALVLVCLAFRLVFESAIYPYYLLATSAMFFVLDLVAHRLPVRSMTWCAAAAFFVALDPANRVTDAVGTLVLALAAVSIGVGELRAASRSSGHTATIPIRA